MKIVEEHIALTPQDPFVIKIYTNPDLSYPFHHHQSAYELTLTLGLSGTRMVGDHTEQFSPRDLVLMAPGLPHCWQDHGIRPKTPHKVVVIQFCEMMFSSARPGSRHLAGIHRALRRSVYGLELLEEAKDKAIAIIDQIDESCSLHAYCDILKVLDMFGNEKEIRQLSGLAYTPPASKKSGNKLPKVLDFIQQNYASKLTLDEAAMLAGMSSSAFSHYFKSRTGKSFTEYINELRLGKAAQLLQWHEMPISMVCNESGFQNISHFNRSFNKRYKVTPLKYRKEYMG
ncbi:MAG: helix-turn-helix transcriptional regulator [Cyclobacteriaceae bacterium]|nr:helix-turn-helix transcriptional regulator [Cyclobacteriaceae bacterium]